MDQYSRPINESLRDSKLMAGVSEEIAASDAYGADNRKSLTKVFEKSWFSRAWPFQEILLASDSHVFGGSLYIHIEYLSTFARLWDEFSAKVLLLSDEAQRNVGSMTQILVTKNHSSQPNPRNSLIQLLRFTQSCQATDRSDKIYSLFSLASDLRPLLSPNIQNQSSYSLHRCSGAPPFGAKCS